MKMAFDLASLSREVVVRAPRIVLLGVEKIGKSTFAAGSDSPVFLPVKGEEGIDALDVFSWPPVQKYQDVLDALVSLYTDKHKHRTVVLDSASALEPIVWEKTCQENGNAESIEKVGGGYAKGYTEALSWWRAILNGLDALRAEKNMASIIIGHVKVKRFDDPAGPSYDQYQFDLDARAANLLYRWADLILFCNTKVVVKKEDAGFGKELHKGMDISGGQRFLYTQKRPAHPGGGRGVFGRLPYELSLNANPQLSWATFQQAVATAMSQS